MAEANPVYLLDITSGMTKLLIEFLQTIQRQLGTPPELSRLFPWAVKPEDFDFNRIRVSVQLSEKLPDPLKVIERERDTAAGRGRADIYDEDDAKRYQWRTPEEYEKKRGQAPARDWEDVRGNILNPKFPRGIILGDPGFGKSWLLRYEGWQLARMEIERLKASQIGTSGVVIPLFARLADLAGKSGSLLERLRQVLEDNRLPHLDRLWPKESFDSSLIATKVRNGQALLLLDAWDEVRDGQLGLRKELEDFVAANDKCRFLFTSRFAGYERTNLDLYAKRWDLVTLSPKQVKEFIHRYFKPAETAGEALAARLDQNLRTNHQVGQLGRIPLMLALLSRLFWQSGAKPLPTRRVEIYESCLQGLVLEWKADDVDCGSQNAKKKTNSTSSRADATRKLRFAAELSLKIFINIDKIDALSNDTILNLMVDGTEDKQATLAVAGQIDELIEDGILVRETAEPNGALRFLHLTFQEYLAATALGSRANAQNGKGWKTARVEAKGVKVTIPQLIDAKSWDPQWQEVIPLLAGTLNDPTSLLKLLSNITNDDIFHHRLRLSALCLGELREGLKITTLIDKIAEATLTLWERTDGYGATRTPLAVAATRSPKIIDKVLMLLHDESTRRKGVAYLRDITHAAATRTDLINTCFDLLFDNCVADYSRYLLVDALAHTTDYSNQFIDHFFRLICDDSIDSRIRSHALITLRTLAHIANARPDAVDRLFTLMRSATDDAPLGFLESHALATFVRASGRTDAIETARALLSDPMASNASRECALVTFTYLIESAKLPVSQETISILFDLLHADWLEPRAAICSLHTIAELPGDPCHVIERLFALMRDVRVDSELRSLVACSLGNLEQATITHPEVIRTLLILLSDDSKDNNVQTAAASALGDLCALVVNYPAVIDVLDHVARDDNKHDEVRAAALVALSKLRGVVSVRIDLEALADFLAHTDEDSITNTNFDEEDIQGLALHGAQNTSVDFTRILNAFVGLLHDRTVNKTSKSCALRILSKMAEASKRVEIVDALIESLLYPTLDHSTCSMVVDALANLESIEIARPKMVGALLVLFKDPNVSSDVKSNAARVLGILGRAGVCNSDIIDAFLASVKDDELDAFVLFHTVSSLSMLRQSVLDRPEVIDVMLKVFTARLGSNLLSEELEKYRIRVFDGPALYQRALEKCGLRKRDRSFHRQRWKTIEQLAALRTTESYRGLGSLALPVRSFFKSLHVIYCYFVH